MNIFFINEIFKLFKYDDICDTRVVIIILIFVLNQYYSSIMFVSKKFFVKPSHFKKSKKHMILIN